MHNMSTGRGVSGLGAEQKEDMMEYIVKIIIILYLIVINLAGFCMMGVDKGGGDRRKPGELAGNVCVPA